MGLVAGSKGDNQQEKHNAEFGFAKFCICLFETLLLATCTLLQL